MPDPGARRRCLAAIVCGLLCAFVLVTEAQKPAVVLIIPVEPRSFTASAMLLVQIWNAEQLDALSKNQSCGVSRNATTGADTIRCPPGVIYRDVSPEKFDVSLASAGARIEIAPLSVRAGERFRIRVSGQSADGCNTTFGEQTTQLGSESRMTVSLVWETTAKACSKGVAR